ncbi:unnamed protein product [Dibothriocephalus latus]|uniref:Uncharacterized protein n=1 Tax=Dibothriocephalus latus TaxID=60516 RepID=A0A3P6PDA1_DIBLA|nr:unnamed protein product [Dibothriocephalus latus]
MTTGSLSAAAEGPSREAAIAGMTVLRVLNVTRQWDFEDDHELKSNMQLLLGELLRNPRLAPNNQKVALQLSHEVLNDQLVESKVDLSKLITPTQVRLLITLCMYTFCFGKDAVCEPTQGRSALGWEWVWLHM